MMQTEDSETLQIVPDPDKLERYHRQQLSAMLDGELSPDQARFMLRRLQHDTALAGCWERWQVCGDVLRGSHHALLPPDFAGRVSAAIAGDPTPVESRAHKRGPRLLRWGGGAALAASVAMAALLVGRQGGIEQDQALPQALPTFATTGGEAAAADPAPTGAAPDVAPAAAVTALAAADATRRVSEARTATRARADAASSAQAPSRSASAPQLAVVPPPAPAASPPPAIEAVPALERAVAEASPGLGDGIGADPFQALPMTVASRPWPRASAESAGGYSVGFGSAFHGASRWPRPLGEVRPGAVELFGLPARPAPQLTGATAIGAQPVPVQAHSGADSTPQPR